MICCCTGHRPKGFPWDYSNKLSEEHQEYLATLRAKIVDLISEGYCHFISGGALGADTDFAEIIIDLREISYPNITLEIAVPCPNQDMKWQDKDKLRYKFICDKADSVKLISNNYTPFCMQKRNEYMVDKSDKVFVIWNEEEKGGTYNTLRYAKKKKKDYSILGLRDFTKKSKAFKQLVNNLPIRVLKKSMNI